MAALHGFVADALQGLVHQFADPMACFRELVQNAVDAGSAEIDVRFEYVDGRLVARVDDYGEGMDRHIIDHRLTRLFSSGKEGDRTKIGKFGIGFVSVFALDPEVVCIDTSRAGEHWRVIFKPDRTFTRVARTAPVDGTKIAIYKTMPRGEAEAFAARARAAIAFWCAHVPADIRVEGASVSRPFVVEQACAIVAEVGDMRVAAGYAGDSSITYYNRGLTLLAEAPGPFPGVEVKLWSPELEHTMTRDNVMRDEGFARALERARVQVSGPLRARLVAMIAERAKHDAPHLASDASDELLDHLAGHLARGDELPRAAWREGLLRCHHAGAADLKAIRKAGKAGELWVAAAPSALTEALHGREQVVLAAEADSAAVRLVKELTGSAPRAIEQHLYTAVRAAEPAGWRGLAPLLATLLEGVGQRPRGVYAGDLGYEGSAVAGRVAVAQDEAYGVSRLAALAESVKGRRLVVHAGHAAVREALALAAREPEFAAYAIVKAYLLGLGGGLAVATDNALVARALEVRCRRTT
ncbi:MAG: ATP-binding protein [Myxococcales bacterium]|nr:ATP-binding protein [Myxococcales bacterium]